MGGTGTRNRGDAALLIAEASEYHCTDFASNLSGRRDESATDSAYSRAPGMQ